MGEQATRRSYEDASVLLSLYGQSIETRSEARDALSWYSKTIGQVYAGTKAEAGEKRRALLALEDYIAQNTERLAKEYEATGKAAGLSAQAYFDGTLGQGFKAVLAASPLAPAVNPADAFGSITAISAFQTPEEQAAATAKLQADTLATQTGLLIQGRINGLRGLFSDPQYGAQARAEVQALETNRAAYITGLSATPNLTPQQAFDTFIANPGATPAAAPLAPPGAAAAPSQAASPAAVPPSAAPPGTPGAAGAPAQAPAATGPLDLDAIEKARKDQDALVKRYGSIVTTPGFAAALAQLGPGIDAATLASAFNTIAARDTNQEGTRTAPDSDILGRALSELSSSPYAAAPKAYTQAELDAQSIAAQDAANARNALIAAAPSTGVIEGKSVSAFMSPEGFAQKQADEKVAAEAKRKAEEEAKRKAFVKVDTRVPGGIVQ